MPSFEKTRNAELAKLLQDARIFAASRDCNRQSDMRLINLLIRTLETLINGEPATAPSVTHHS